MATGQMAEKNDKNKLKKILSIYVWDIANKKILSVLDGFHTIAVVLLSFSPNSKYLFTCGNDDKNTFAVYDWKSSSILYSGPVSRAKVNGIAWKNDH
jgi:WD40 repeat protein